MVCLKPSNGDVFFTESNSGVKHNYVRKLVQSTNRAVRVAGKYNKQGNAGDGGPGTAATLYEPFRMCAGPDDVVYFISGNAIRSIDASGNIDNRISAPTQANVNTLPANADEVNLRPTSIACGSDGTVYVGSQSNHKIFVVK